LARPRSTQANLQTAAYGSTSCIPCDTHGTPSDPATFQWDDDCDWKCKPAFYYDRISTECLPCQIPCQQFGQYRPFCDMDALNLPLCRDCPPPVHGLLHGTHFTWTSSAIATASNILPSCSYQCLPAYTKTTACAPCDPPPLDSEYVPAARNASCVWRCKRGFRQPPGETRCQSCTLVDHPRQLSQVLHACYKRSKTKDNTDN
jgi:hypothetical protein